MESHVLELKLKALILDTIHSIEVVQQLLRAGIKSLDDWTWQKQLRFYLEKGLLAIYLSIYLSIYVYVCIDRKLAMDISSE